MSGFINEQNKTFQVFSPPAAAAASPVAALSVAPIAAAPTFYFKYLSKYQNECNQSC